MALRRDAGAASSQVPTNRSFASRSRRRSLFPEPLGIQFLNLVCDLGCTCSKSGPRCVMVKRSLRVITVFGTRPEAIKLAPVVTELRTRSDVFQSSVCVTGRRKREMVDQVIDLFSIRPDFDLKLMQHGQRLAGFAGTRFSRTGCAVPRRKAGRRRSARGHNDDFCGIAGSFLQSRQGCACGSGIALIQ